MSHPLRAVAVAAALSIAPAQAAERIVPGDLLTLPPADVVILGEVHDNPEHHRNQAAALQALAPAAVAFEMLTPEQAATVNALGGAHPDLAARLDWESGGWPDFALYAPVFAALGEARAYGMALPRAEVRRAFEDGAAGVFGAEAGRFGLDRPLPEAQQAAREAAQQDAHCNALPPEILPGMVAAQRLRDAAFARTVLHALDETGGPVAVITGSGHARTDWGMPVYLRAAAPAARLLSIGQVEAADGLLPADLPPFDRVLVAPPAEREDPCAAFRATGE